MFTSDSSTETDSLAKLLVPLVSHDVIGMAVVNSARLGLQATYAFEIDLALTSPIIY